MTCVNKNNKKQKYFFISRLDFIEKKSSEVSLIKNTEITQTTSSNNDYDGFESKPYTAKSLSENNIIPTNPNCINSEGNNVKNINLRNDIKFFQKEGECFGDCEIINNNSKTTIAIASEDSDLFVLEKDYFMDYLSKPIIKSENERKLFIKKIIKPLTSCGFDDFYNKLNPIVKKLHLLFLIFFY